MPGVILRELGRAFLPATRRVNLRQHGNRNIVHVSVLFRSSGQASRGGIAISAGRGDVTATLAGARVGAYIPATCDIINFIATLCQQNNARNVPLKFRYQTYFGP